MAFYHRARYRASRPFVLEIWSNHRVYLSCIARGANIHLLSSWDSKNEHFEIFTVYFCGFFLVERLVGLYRFTAGRKLALARRVFSHIRLAYSWNFIGFGSMVDSKTHKTWKKQSLSLIGR